MAVVARKEHFYYADLTLKCRVSLANEIKLKLDLPERELLLIFRRTPFGPWLDVTMPGGDPQLVHMFLQKEVQPENPEPEELYYDVYGHHMRFGRQEFCLLTGLRFGPTPSLPPLADKGFVSRVWPDCPPEELKEKMVVQRMKEGLEALSDEDGVRVCLLVMVEIMFMGREMSQVVSDTVLRAVEDLNVFNIYPWGSHIWEHTYKQLHRAIDRRADKHGKMTMSGFVYAFKIWILEMFPISQQNFTMRDDRFIRGIRWDRGVSLNKNSCLNFFNSVTSTRFRPRARLEPTTAEMNQSWFHESIAFFQRDAGTRPTNMFRRSSPSRSGSSSSTGSLSADEDDARPHHSEGVIDRYEAPPRSSHHGMPPTDPYQARWAELDALKHCVYEDHEKRLKALEDLASQFSAVQISSLRSSYIPSGFGHTQTALATFSTTSTFIPQNFGTSKAECCVPKMTTTYDMPGPSYVTPPTYTQNGDYYEATLTIKARISIAKDIFVKLRESDTRFALFRDTCFGPWLDIRSTNGDPLLIHLILQTQFFPEGARSDEMWFRIRGHELRFGREEFCLITGLRFGPMDALQETPANPFRDRVFPHIPTHQHVKGSDLWSVFTSRDFARIPDLDAIRICLLLLLEVGFSGRQPHSMVSGFLLRLVEDLDAWNRYPWGSYLWALTYPQLKTALPRRQHRVGVRADRIAYTLTGFIFAFKIWIFETFPVARRFASRSDAIPRAIAWQWTQTIMWDTCLTFLDVNDPLMVTSTAVERETDWWRDSRRFFDSVADDFQPPTKRPRSCSPPRPPRPPPPSLSSSARVGASSPETATNTQTAPTPLESLSSSARVGASSLETATTTIQTAPTPLEQRVAVLEQAVRDLQAGQRALEVGQRDLEVGQRATQAGQRAILESMARLHETVQRALEADHRTKVQSKDTLPIVVDDDVAEGAP